MKSLKFALAPLALALALPGVAMAHSDQPTVAATSTLLTITAEGKSTRTPDMAVFTAGVVSEGCRHFIARFLTEGLGDAVQR